MSLEKEPVQLDLISIENSAGINNVPGEDVSGEIELKTDMGRALSILPESLKRVIESKYLTNNGAIISNEAVGWELGVTGQTVKTREGKAFRKLRHPTRKKLFQEYR